MCVCETDKDIETDRKELPLMLNTHTHTHLSNTSGLDSWSVGGKAEDQLSLEIGRERKSEREQ